MENITIKIKLLPLPRSGLPLPSNTNANHKWPTYEYRRCWALLWRILCMSRFGIANIGISKWRILLLLRSKYCSWKTAKIADTEHKVSGSAILNDLNGNIATVKWPDTADAEQYSTVLLLPSGIYRRCWGKISIAKKLILQYWAVLPYCQIAVAKLWGIFFQMS